MTSPSTPVAAAPFRAHVHHVCAAAGVGWPIFALHSGLPYGLVQQLLDRRPGRTVQRISTGLAQQVLDVSADALVQLRAHSVPAGRSRHLLTQLGRQGWTTAPLAARLHTSIGLLRAVSVGEVTAVPRLLELQLTALAEATHRRQRGAAVDALVAA